MLRAVLVLLSIASFGLAALAASDVNMPFGFAFSMALIGALSLTAALI